MGVGGRKKLTEGTSTKDHTTAQKGRAMDTVDLRGQKQSLSKWEKRGLS